METPYTPNTIPTIDNEQFIVKNKEATVENEPYISSKKCEFDGLTSNISTNEDPFYQSSCDDIVKAEEPIEIIKNEEKSPKIVTATTATDNRNSTELRDERMEKDAYNAEPLLNETFNEEEKNLLSKSFKSSTESMLYDNTTTKKNKNKKSPKLLKHKKSYVKLYLKLKDKLNNNKTKSHKKLNKTEADLHDVTTSPKSYEPKDIKYDEDDIQNAFSDDLKYASFPGILRPDETKIYSSIDDMTPINGMDVREITVINAEGETILLPATKRMDSLTRYPVNPKRHSIQSDTTITPKKLKKEKSIVDPNSPASPVSTIKVIPKQEADIETNIIPKSEEVEVTVEPDLVTPLEEKLSFHRDDVVPEERPSVRLEDIPEQKEIKEKREIKTAIEDEKEKEKVAVSENVTKDTTVNSENQKIVVTTIQKEVIPNEHGDEQVVVTTTIEEHIYFSSDEEEEEENEIAEPLNEKEKVKEEENTPSFSEISEKKKKFNENSTITLKANDQDNDMIGAGISMVKPFHPENKSFTPLLEEAKEPITKNIDLPFINENVESTPSVKEDTLSTPVPNVNITNDEPKIPLVKMSEEDIEKRKLSYKRKPLKTSLKKSALAIRYFRKPKEEPPHYVVVEDFEKFKENTERNIETSRNFESNTTLVHENNEKFKETVKENFDEMKVELANMNENYETENKKLREELVNVHQDHEMEKKRLQEEIDKLQQQVSDLEEEREKDMEQLRNEVAEEIIKLQESIKVLEKEKAEEIKQLQEEIEALHQKEDNYQDVIEHHLLNINTTLVKLKEENVQLREEMLNEIQKINDRKIMETNPEDLVKQEEIENISKQVVKSNVQWNELSHHVQNLPVQLQKEVEDKFETMTKDQAEKRKQYDEFIADTKKNQNKLERCIKELIKLQKANETNIETQTRSLNESISLQSQQLQDYEETKNQLWAQNEKLNSIGDRVDRYCTNDYLDTVIELDDLRKITNRTTEELFNLQKLNLYCKNLDRLPKRIFSLENLNELWLGRNNLNNLNDKVGNLKNLKRLSVADNNLSQLPIGIKNLKNLTHLYLYKNKLKELPPEIGELENLIHLDVESNKLTKLPEELKNLSKLENLDIENNSFNEFPKIIFELKNLVKL